MVWFVFIASNPRRGDNRRMSMRRQTQTKMDAFATWCDMRKLTSLLIGAVIVAWMAYLSWPVTADVPERPRRAVESAPVSKGVPAANFQSVDTYEHFESKAATQPAV
jgi:hypothetical protein